MAKEAIFFLLLRLVKKVGYAFFRNRKVFKVLLVIFKKFLRHSNRSAVIIIKLTMPSYFTYIAEEYNILNYYFILIKIIITEILGIFLFSSTTIFN